LTKKWRRATRMRETTLTMMQMTRTLATTLRRLSPRLSARRDVQTEMVEMTRLRQMRMPRQLLVKGGRRRSLIYPATRSRRGWLNWSRAWR
jgi:hypothetical protein